MTRNLTIATIFLLGATFLLGYIWVREHNVLLARSARFQGNLEAKGAHDYEQYCASCHGLAGEGGVANGAPQINNLPTTLQAQSRLDGATGITAKYGTVLNFVESTVTSGVRGTAMPRWSARLGGPLRDDQIINIATYVQGFWATPGNDKPNLSPGAIELADAYKKAQQAANVPASTDPVVLGGAIFQSNCASCHNLTNKDSAVPAPGLGGLFGPDGTEAYGKVLPNQKEVTVDNWIEWIKKGGVAFMNGPQAEPAAGHGPYQIAAMPPFPGLTDDQIKQLLAFLSTHDRNGEQKLPPIGIDGKPLPAQPAAAAPADATPTPAK